MESRRQEVTPVSVVLIVKDCADSLAKCLASLRDNFLTPADEVVCVDTGSTDKTIQVARAAGARVIVRSDLRKDIASYVRQWLPDSEKLLKDWPMFNQGCIMDFAAARQVATDAAKNDVQFWIDSDDVLGEDEPGTLRRIVDERMPELDSIFLPYYYAFDPGDGRPITVLKRERLFRRSKFYWKGRCHELAIPKDGVTPRMAWFADYKGGIVHAGARSSNIPGDIRNYCIIRREIEEDEAAGREPDTRSIFYLGNACRGLRMDSEALEAYRITAERSGSRDDIFSCYYYSGNLLCLPDVSRPVAALGHFQKCVEVAPLDPRGYIGLARCYALLGRYKEALYNYDAALLLPEPVESTHAYDPEHIHTLPHHIAAECGIKLGDRERVEQALGRLRARRAGHPDVEKATAYIRNWLAGQDLIASVRTMAINHRPKDQADQLRILRKIVKDLPEVPPELEERGVGHIEGPDTRPPGFERATFKNDAGETETQIRWVKGSERDVCIFCGPTHEAWGPANRKTGIGGSEKAVLEMAPRLTERGWRVSVYANVPKDQRGVDKDGVLWAHWSEFDDKRPRNILISWRSPRLVLSPIPALYRIVWCHDVQDPSAWTDDVCAVADEVWVLSEYHATTLDAAREKLGNKVVITRNGIDCARLARAIDGKQPIVDLWRPKNVFFASSPDRGILTAIKLFQETYPAEGYPAARLHLAYGFNKHYLSTLAKYEYVHIPDVAASRNGYSYMEEVLKEIDKDERIKYYGRVGPDRLYEIASSCSYWLYPTRFPEISCMTAMETQALGLVPVTSQKAALAETVLFKTYKANPDAEPAARKHLVRRMFDIDKAVTPEDRRKLMEEARKAFDYEALADEWSDRLAALMKK